MYFGPPARKNMQNSSNKSRTLITRPVNLDNSVCLVDTNSHSSSPTFTQVEINDFTEDFFVTQTNDLMKTESLTSVDEVTEQTSTKSDNKTKEHVYDLLSSDAHINGEMPNHISEVFENNDNDIVGNDDDDETLKTKELNGGDEFVDDTRSSSSSTPPNNISFNESITNYESGLHAFHPNDIILNIGNEQETSCVQSSEGVKNENILLTIIHYQSVGTSTQDETVKLKDEGCQCYPEELFSDETSEEDNIIKDMNVFQDGALTSPVPTINSTISPTDTKNPQANLSGMTKLDVIRMRQDLLKAHNKIQALDLTLRKMRAEKLDMLGQMRNLHATLESKEEQVNSFITNFEMKFSESSNIISRLIAQQAHLEKVNQDVEMKLQNALDQCVSLSLDLDLKNQVIEQLNIQVESSQVSHSDSNLSSIKIPTVAIETNFSRSSTNDDLRKPQDLQDQLLTSSEASHNLSIGKVVNDDEDANKGLLSKEGRRLPSLSDVHQIHISQWKANHVLAWLEQDLNMGYYSQQCKENVKSGKVLLSMTDQELDSAFGLQSPIHRRKLRISIDHLSNPQIKKFPQSDQLTTAWITGVWLPGLGLPQFGPVFEAQLVDGRILEHLTIKELEKNFTMISKTHISSVLAGIQLLRMFDFDRNKLEEQRQMKGKNGCLMWTNADVINWLEDIDLQEYAMNLKKSGIHGALMVLDEKFTPIQLAGEMGLQSSKSYLLRHLSQEYNDIVGPARLSVGSSFNLNSDYKTATLSRAFSSSSKAKREDFFSSSMSFKGSLGRAFGKKAKKDMIQVVPTSEPVRMPAELLSIFDSPVTKNHSHLMMNENNSTSYNPLNTSISAFSSLQSLPATTLSNTTSKANVIDIISPSTPYVVMPHDDVKKLYGDKMPGPESSKSQKSKTPKNKSNYFSLRTFSSSSRRKSAK